MFKSISRKTIKIMLVILCLSIVGITLAQRGEMETTATSPDKPYVLQTPIGDTTEVDDLSDYIRMLYSYFVLASGVLATAMIMFGGYIWITAMGNQTKISRAKEFIFSAVTGLLLALFSYLLLYTVNPEIVALKPLNVAMLETPKVIGPPVTVCNLSQKGPGKNDLVECGDVINYGAGDEVKYCTGVVSVKTWSEDDNDLCHITENPFTKSKTGTQLSETIVPGRGEADINNDRYCGMVVMNWEDWKVGAFCTLDHRVNGKDIRNLGRCVIEAEEINVVKNDVGACDYDKVLSLCQDKEWNFVGAKNKDDIELCGCIAGSRCVEY